MKARKILGTMGILGLTLAFGLVLSSCEIEPETFTLRIRNDFNANISIIIDELAGTANNPIERPAIQTGIMAYGGTASFTLPHGEYRVVIHAAGLPTPVGYPSLTTYRRMSGNTMLVFNGMFNRE